MHISGNAAACELRHLRYFVAVAEELSFTRAAARLHMAQPPLSQQIGQLERQIGYALLTRRPVTLTPAGAVFLESARAILSDVSSAIEASRHAARGERGVLNVGFASTAMFRVLPRIIAAVRSRHPDVSVRFRELHSGGQLQALESGDIDVALSRECISGPEFVSTALVREPLVAVVPSAHPLARHRRLSLDALQDEPFVVFPRQLAPTLYDDIMRECRLAGFVPRIAQELAEWHTIVGCVATGAGVSLAPASVDAMRWRGAEYRGLRHNRVHTALFLSRRRMLSATAATFVDVARACFK